MIAWQAIGSAPKDRDILVKGGVIQSFFGEGPELEGMAHVCWNESRQVWEVMHCTDDISIDSPTHWHEVPERVEDQHRIRDAAPALLEALEGLLASSAGYSETELMVRYGAPSARHIIAGRAAISQARGVRK